MTNTRLLRGDDDGDLDEAAAILRAGGLVALPTETVYGLGAHGLDDDAVRRVFAAKGRPADNPVILHVLDIERALSLWSLDDTQREHARALAARFWPGPLTLVLPAAPQVPSAVTAGLATVAVRAPAHPVARALLARLDFPLAAPSANASSRPSPTTAAHVLRTLGGRVDAVLDGGPTDVGLESTVLDLSRAPPRVLRPGDVGVDALRALLDDVVPFAGDPAHAASPGLRHLHYAPAGVEVRLANEAALTDAWPDDTVAIIARAHTAARLGPRRGFCAALPDTPAGFARELYAALYRVEDAGAATLLVERPPDDDAWRAVRDRVRRAARATAR